VLIQRVATGPRFKWLAAGWLTISNRKLCKKTVSCFECFPYVCPEPVLTKRSFFYTNGSKDFLTC
jgi:hypothetical protein